ncbi:Type-1 restriction enzyme EcoKI specificity protein [Pseudomonas fluorescens]|nr:Type-1 restriction enzyme EcoKI specificity protein [Pseudomonas fluorescens]
MGKLPSNWKLTSLGSVTKRVLGGGTPSRSNRDFYRGKIRFMTVKDMKSFSPLDTVDKISEDALWSSSTNLIPANTPIVSTRMGLGKIVVADFDTAINQDLKAIFLNPNLIYQDYFVFWYRSMSRKIRGMGTGTTVQGITLTQLADLVLPLPPLNEQIRITKKVDELLVAVDAIKLHISNANKILPKIRHAILAAATSGLLTREWRKTSQHVSTDRLRECIANTLTGNETEAARKAYGENIPSHWSLHCLDDLADRENGIPYGVVQTGKVFQNGIPTVRCGDVKFLGIDVSQLKTIDPEIEENYKRTRLAGGEVLLAIRGSVGNVGVAPKSLRNCNISREVAMISTVSSVSPFFIACVLQSPIGSSLISAKVKGVAQKGINLSDVRRLPIVLPPPDEQEEIARRVKQLFAVVEAIEGQIKSASERITPLIGSIFSRAFNGGLVASDDTDEPAAKMLDRVFREDAARQADKVDSINISPRKIVKKSDINSVRKWVENSVEESFSFDDLREALSIDYESLKEFVFDLLSENPPTFEQVFDKNIGSVYFRKPLQ